MAEKVFKGGWADVHLSAINVSAPIAFDTESSIDWGSFDLSPGMT